MNEELGDGIMSAIDMFADFKVIEGAQVMQTTFNRVLHDAAAENLKVLQGLHICVRQLRLMVSDTARICLPFAGREANCAAAERQGECPLH